MGRQRPLRTLSSQRPLSGASSRFERTFGRQFLTGSSNNYLDVTWVYLDLELARVARSLVELW